MKIIVCDPIAATAVEKMKAAGLDVDVRDDISIEDLTGIIAGYEGMVVRSRTKARQPLIDAATRLKVIVRGGVGLDNIDVAYAESKGIAVLNTPSASSASVAELAIGYMFALARLIPQSTASMRAGLWQKKKFKGSEIGGKTLGIIGIGRIGKATAMRAQALGMEVIAFDPYVKRVPGIEIMALNDLLAKSDYISLHLPHTDETHDLLDKAAFEVMKDGIRIVNCARGGVVNEDALYDAIVAGKVAGAAVDVFAEEPAKGHKLFELDQVIGSPHIGASTAEGQARVGDEVAERMAAFAKENA